MQALRSLPAAQLAPADASLRGKDIEALEAKVAEIFEMAKEHLAGLEQPI
jgi:hypothetical protein